MAKILFFLAGPKPTTAEQTHINRLAAKGYDVKVRNSRASTKYGTKIETCDGIAGIVPAGYEAKTDFSLAPVAKPEAFKVFPAAVSLGAAETRQLVAAQADLAEDTGVITITDQAADAGTTYASADETKCTVNATGLVTRVAAGGPTNVTATRTSVAATKATLDCSQVPGKQLDTVLEAKTAGTGGNDITVALVGDGVAKAGSIARDTNAFTIHYLPDTSTVADVEALVTGLGGADDLVDVKTAGTGGTVLTADAAFPAQSLAGGAAAVTQTSVCAVTTT